MPIVTNDWESLLPRQKCFPSRVIPFCAEHYLYNKMKGDVVYRAYHAMRMLIILYFCLVIDDVSPLRHQYVSAFYCIIIVAIHFL